MFTHVEDSAIQLTVEKCRKCGSHVSEDALIEAEKHFSANVISRVAFEKLNPNAANTTIPIYFHIISSDPTVDGGNIS